MAHRQETTWLALKAAEAGLRALPHPVALEVGEKLGALLCAFSKERARRAQKRCARALCISESEAERIVKASYRHFGRCVAEFLRMPLLKDTLLSLVTIHGEEHIRKAMDAGKGVIFLTAHLGNWEFAAATLSLKGYPMNAIGAPQRDDRITERISELRLSCGVRTIGKGFDLKAALYCLKRGEGLGVLLDQDAREKGVLSSFLGLPASTPIGPVKMAYKLGSPVIPIFTMRRKDGVSYDMYVEPPLEGERGRPFGEDVEASVLACDKVISSWIRRFPEQWLWLYPRWATTLGDR